MFLRTAFFCVPLLLAVGGPGRAADPPKTLNLLIVTADDMNADSGGWNGSTLGATPNLDAFAKESVRLTDFHVAPMCSPTRGQLLTGLAALRNGATSVTAGRTFLRPGLPTLPEVGLMSNQSGLPVTWKLKPQLSVIGFAQPLALMRYHARVGLKLPP